MEINDRELSNVDIVSIITYKGHQKQLIKYIEKATILHKKFWSHLIDDVTELKKLADIVDQINSVLGIVEKHWERMKKYKQNSAKIMKLYGDFLLYVLNDKEGSKEIIRSISEAKNISDNNYDINRKSNKLSTYNEKGYGVIIVTSANEENSITDINMSVCSMFGYDKVELIGKDISILIPILYAEKHKEILNSIEDRIDYKHIYKEKFVHGKHKSGYVFAINKLLKSLHSVLNNWQYVVTVCIDQKKSGVDTAIVLVDKEMIIRDVSFSMKLFKQ